jgi:hypothetical protein
VTLSASRTGSPDGVDARPGGATDREHPADARSGRVPL